MGELTLASMQHAVTLRHCYNTAYGLIEASGDDATQEDIFAALSDWMRDHPDLEVAMLNVGWSEDTGAPYISALMTPQESAPAAFTIPNAVTYGPDAADEGLHRCIDLERQGERARMDQLEQKIASQRARLRTLEECRAFESETERQLVSALVEIREDVDTPLHIRQMASVATSRYAARKGPRVGAA